ncbi:hypothetical protein CRG98_033883 [Punica granatum]|uniref:CCHC-type domain-containing protein n=1 Tax=Punica granatum TaxID=22663 RepID=A0A2I0IQ17_PUNGR|nr:hypothetical protein CRG98_033883 [Punica granatum]
MTPLLATYGLLDHVEGRTVAPNKTIIGADGVTTPNPDYLRWESRDNFALTCVMLAVTEEIGVTILAAKTSQEAWASLATSFLTQTAAQEDLLDQQWRDLKKGNINRRIYTGLGPDWEPIVLAQLERMLTMSTDELQSLLVGHEERRLYAHGPQSNPSASAPLSGLLGAGPTEVLYTDGQKGSNGSKKNYGKNNAGKKNSGSRGGSGGSGNFGPFTSSRPSSAYNTARGPASFGNSAFRPNSMIICQLCNRPGHTALSCQYSEAQAHLTHGASPGIHDPN